MNQLNISRYSPLVLVGDTSLLRPFSDSFPVGIVGNTRNNHRLCHRHRPTGWPTYSGSHRSISPGKWPASVLWLLSLLYTAAFLAWLEQLQDALFIHDDLWQAEGSKENAAVNYRRTLMFLKSMKMWGDAVIRRTNTSFAENEQKPDFWAEVSPHLPMSTRWCPSPTLNEVLNSLFTSSWSILDLFYMCEHSYWNNLLIFFFKFFSFGKWNSPPFSLFLPASFFLSSWE